jgi:hypothetical protein
LSCDVLATPDNGGPQMVFSATDMTAGLFTLGIGTATAQSPNPAFFYTVRCTLPTDSPSAPSIYGVRTFTTTLDVLMPSSPEGFVPTSYPSGSVLELSMGYYSEYQTGFVLEGKMNGGTLSCYVYAWDKFGGVLAFSNSTSAGGFVSLNTIATTPGNPPSFYTMRCFFPPGFELRGAYPGH